MFIKQKYIIRHKILEVLQNKMPSFDEKEIKREQIELSLEEISKILGFSIENIYKNIDHLSEAEEINFFWINNNKLKCAIARKGTLSVYDRKYINEGRKEFWNNTFDVIKNVSTILILIIAIVTFIINTCATTQNSKDIKIIKTEINNFKDVKTN